MKGTFEVRPGDDGVLWLAGELDLAEVDTFLKAASASLEQRRDVVLECSALTFLDSSGIQAILTVASRSAGALVILNPCPPVRHVLAIAGVDRLTDVVIEPS